MSLPRYAKYKESGVGWLGRVPAHWDVLPTRIVARLESGHTPSRQHPEYWENCTIPWFSLGDVWQIREAGRSVISETAEKISELGMANSAARRLPAGTVMLSRTASVGFAAIMGVDMATTQDFANWVCGPRVTPAFLLSVFHAMKGEFTRLMYGSTHNTIYMPDIQAFRMPLPSLDEQLAIARFLDRETAKIDALVAEQDRLIELLKEKRQAVISHAVTKGLNPAAPMKDSGIEWLGTVPAHWDVLRCARATSILCGFAFPSAEFSESEAHVRLLRGINIGVGSIRWDDVVRWQRRPDDGLDAYALSEGDLVIGMDRPLISGGMRVAVLEAGDVPCLLLQRVACIRPSRDLLPRFLAHLLASPMFVAHFAPETTGVSVPHISPDQIGNFRIPLPPIAEQRAICKRLKADLHELDELACEAQRGIDLLAERRAALISAAVTGQIDVRDVAARSAA